jgi:hypothetical protein
MNASVITRLLLAFNLVFLFSCKAHKPVSGAGMVARMQVNEPIEGVCDNSNVIAILPFPGNGQVKAKAPKKDDEIITELNSRVTYLKDKATYEDKGMVSMIVNCKGEMVRCEIDNKTKSPELDNQIVAVLSEMKAWTAGTINGKAYDTVVLYSFTIKNGKFTAN